MGFKIFNNKLIKYTEEPGITNITIPYGVTNIGYGAFWGCTSLTSITIPDSVTSTGNWAFRDCTSLTGVTIPDSITELGNCAFYGCTSLTSVIIPDSVTLVGSWVFYGCTSLKNVTINSDNINNIKELNIPSFVIIKCNPDSITDKAAKAAGYATEPIMTPLQKALLDAQDIIKNNTNNNLSIER